MYEVIAHWISSYFLGDDLRLPSTVEQALAERDRNAAWTRKRYPDVLTSANESNSSGLASWSCVLVTLCAPFVLSDRTLASKVASDGRRAVGRHGCPKYAVWWKLADVAVQGGLPG